MLKTFFLALLRALAGLTGATTASSRPTNGTVTGSRAGSEPGALEGATPALALAGLAGDPGKLDPAGPPLCMTLVERRRLRVNPLNAYGNRVSAGPFDWQVSDAGVAKLCVAADTLSAWLYPVALGNCLVTVAGAKRQACVEVEVVPAVPVLLNLVADGPELFRAVSDAVDSPPGSVL